ncbi:hypothetical protein ACYSNR_08260 [Enterococcus sp. LJL128]|uniref:hypothetical protein n=1 Tax=Enterococcus sp. LJL51 TaxID=3416656 RepID=UPI003CF201E2
MIDSLKDELKDIRKNLEKSLIRSFTASHSRHVSDTRKQRMKQAEETIITALKSNSSNYLSSLTTAAKGKWVTQAKKSFKETTKQFEQF